MPVHVVLAFQAVSQDEVTPTVGVAVPPSLTVIAVPASIPVTSPVQDVYVLPSVEPSAFRNCELVPPL